LNEIENAQQPNSKTCGSEAYAGSTSGFSWAKQRLRNCVNSRKNTSIKARRSPFLGLLQNKMSGEARQCLSLYFGKRLAAAPLRA